jgi:hypothetical protein
MLQEGKLGDIMMFLLVLVRTLAEPEDLDVSSESAALLSPAPAPVERTTGGMGKSWEPAPEGDFRFCQYVSPRVAHKSGRCDCMSSPSPFSPVRWRAYDVYLRTRVLDAGIPAWWRTVRVGDDVNMMSS